MAKELRLDVVVKKDSRQLEELAAEFQAANKAIDDNGKSMQKNASFAKALDAQIDKTKKQVHDLGVEADKTGNVDVFKNLRNAEKNLAGLERLKKQLSSALDIKVDVNGNQRGGGFFSNFGSSLKNLVTGAGLSGVQAGDAFGKGFVGTVGEVVSAAGPVLIPAAALLANELVAVAGAGITAGIGGAGLAAGIAGAFQDPQVKQAASGLGTTLKGTLTEVGKDFVDPVRTAILDLNQAAFRGSDQVAKAFEPLTRAIGPIEKGIEGFVSSALPGLTRAFKDAEPVLEEVGKQLPGLGRAIGDSISKIASNVNQNKAAIQLTFQVIDKTIEGLGSLISTSEKVFGGMVRAIEPVAVALDDTVGALERLIGDIPLVGKFTPFKFFGDQIHGAREQVGDLNHTLGEHNTYQGLAADAVKVTNDAYYQQYQRVGDMRTATLAAADAEARLTAQFDDQVNKLLTLEGDQDAYQKGLNDLSDALSKNTHTLRGNSDDAIQNRQAIRDLIGQAEAARQAAIDHAGGVNASSAAIKAANDAYEANIQKLEAVGVQLGLRKQDLDAIVGEYDISIVVGVSGQGKGLVEIGSGSNAVFNLTGKGLKLRAAGGPVEAGQPYIVGEKQPELFVPNVSGRIIPNVPAPVPFRTSSAARSSSSGGGWVVTSGGDSKLAEFLHSLEREGILQFRRK